MVSSRAARFESSSGPSHSEVDCGRPGGEPDDRPNMGDENGEEAADDPDRDRDQQRGRTRLSVGGWLAGSTPTQHVRRAGPSGESVTRPHGQATLCAGPTSQSHAHREPHQHRQLGMTCCGEVMPYAISPESRSGSDIACDIDLRKVLIPRAATEGAGEPGEAASARADLRDCALSAVRMAAAGSMEGCSPPCAAARSQRAPAGAGG